jgi:hypothetical protein
MQNSLLVYSICVDSLVKTVPFYPIDTGLEPNGSKLQCEGENGHSEYVFYHHVSIDSVSHDVDCFCYMDMEWELTHVLFMLFM